MLGKYINQFMADNELSVNEEFFIKNMDGNRVLIGCADCYKIEDGEGEIIHSKPDEGYIYSESVYAFVKCKKCNACGPITDVDYNHATSGNPGRLKAINKAIELAVKGWNRRDGSKANG